MMKNPANREAVAQDLVMAGDPVLTLFESRESAPQDSKTLSISSLSLYHFRNYEHARLSVFPAPVVLFGHNGAGKTNILEALSLLVPGRGLRRARLGDFIQHGPHPNPLPKGEGVSALSLWEKGGDSRDEGYSWAVVSNIQGLQGEAMIATGRDTDAVELEKRAVKIDGKPAKSQAELARHMSMLWLTPQMEQIFLEGTSEGRKFLDRLVYTFEPEQASFVNAYELAMRERNRLLANGVRDEAWLSALEQTMSEKAAAIASARLSTVQHINHAVESSSLSFPKPLLAVRGMVEDLLSHGLSALEAEQRFREALAANRGQDAVAGRTLSGTHRSELQVMHRDKNMPAHQCSTGEQKALILSTVLAQSRAGARWNGVVPVILLDEVVAHLDPGRRIELFDEIADSGAQAWMTGTDQGLFSGMAGRAQFIEICAGEVFQ